MQTPDDLPYRLTKAYAIASVNAKKERANMRHSVKTLWKSEYAVTASASVRSERILGYAF